MTMPRELTITLPDDLAAKAESDGLLTSEAIESWLREEVRRRAWDRLFEWTKRIDAANDEPPMSDEELETLIAEARAERRANGACGG